MSHEYLSRRDQIKADKLRSSKQHFDILGTGESHASEHLYTLQAQKEEGSLYVLSA